MLRSVLLALLLVAPSFAQYEGAPPTRRQILALQPLVEATCKRLELHLPSFKAHDLESRIKKTLQNQVTRVVERRYKALLIELLLEDLGLSHSDERNVQYGPLENFGMDVPDWPSDLLGFEGPGWNSRDKGAYKVTEVTSDHSVMVAAGSADVEFRLAAWIGREPDKDQARGLKELSRYWAGRLEQEFGYERKNRDFHDLMESVFVSLDTERAVFGTLCKLRFLLRPQVREGLQAKTFEEIMAAESSVGERIERVLGAAEWWKTLQEDHRAMIADPKAHRDVIKQRVKDEKQQGE